MSPDDLDLSSVRKRVKGFHPLLAEQEYRTFLTLYQQNPGKSVSPTPAADAFWHAHILDTLKYHRDCLALFGSFLHHVPGKLGYCATGS
jgi:hypothetical protein